MYGVECLNPTMDQNAFDNRKLKPTAMLAPRDEQRMPPLHQYYVPNFKSKSKSRANSYTMEFLSQVFASEGASRFFKTFLLRFLFDSGSQSSDDGSAMLMLSPAR